MQRVAGKSNPIQKFKGVAVHVSKTNMQFTSVSTHFHIAVIMSLHWVSRAKCVDTQRGNQMNLITSQAAYHIE
jgi:hypothetical protein